MKKIFALIIATTLSACINTSNTNTTYDATEIGASAEVSYGKIISMRQVTLKGNNNVGTLSGAVAGGALGSQIGGNDAVGVAGAVGGAILGGFVGGEVENAIRNDQATEFIIKRTNGKTVAVVQTNEEGFKVGDKVMIIDSTKNTGGSIRIAKDN